MLIDVTEGKGLRSQPKLKYNFFEFQFRQRVQTYFHRGYHTFITLISNNEGHQARKKTLFNHRLTNHSTSETINTTKISGKWNSVYVT